MAIKTYNPRTPSQRYRQSLTFDDITRSTPEKSLSSGKSSKAGRGAGGRISVRRRGGGHKRKYRVIDFKREKNSGFPEKLLRLNMIRIEVPTSL